jgi:hypothetical protein
MPTDPRDHAEPDHTEPLDTIDSAEQGSARTPRWRQAATAVIAVLALVAAGVVGAALASGTDSSDALPAASSTDEESGDADADPWDRMRRFREWAEETGPGMLRGRGHAFAPGFGHGMLGALHGSFVVPDSDGGYRTVVVQRGEVTAVSETSLTVVSEDDFTTTYRLDDDTLVMGGTGGVDAIDEGDRVSVTGERTDGGVRAVHVTDLSAFDRLPRGPWGPTPSPSTTTEGTSASV